MKGNMGRYYSGDIEGKFWFAVQSSNDASHFGGESCQPNHQEFWFDTDNLPDIKAGIKKCIDGLGKYKAELDKFFKDNNGYNDEMIVKDFKISKDKVKKLLVWYARLQLGEKIKKCIAKNGSCEFEAEL